MSIVETVYENDFINAFDNRGRGNNFSYKARASLYDYYESYSDDMGEDYKLDVIAICCEWTEYTIPELFYDYSYVVDDVIELEKEFREVNGLDTTTDNNDDTYEKFFVEPLNDDDTEEFNEILFEKIIEELENKTTIIQVEKENTVLIAEF